MKCWFTYKWLRNYQTFIAHALHQQRGIPQTLAHATQVPCNPLASPEEMCPSTLTKQKDSLFVYSFFSVINVGKITNEKKSRKILFLSSMIFISYSIIFKLCVNGVCKYWNTVQCLSFLKILFCCRPGLLIQFEGRIT